MGRWAPTFIGGVLTSGTLMAQPALQQPSAPPAASAAAAHSTALPPANETARTMSSATATISTELAQRSLEPGVRDVVLHKGTPIRLMVVTEVSSKTASSGYRFPLRVDEDVVVDHHVLIPTGTTAFGEVSDVRENGVLGKSGRLSVRLLGIDIGGYRIPLAGEQYRAGRNAADKVVFSVLAFGGLGFFMSGNNAKLKGGDIIMGETGEDVVFAATGEVHVAPAVSTTAPRDVADELEKLASLRDRGVLTPAEFNAEKAKLLEQH